MLVTLPCVMLLLDYWPLERLKTGRLRALLWEKIPFFALAAAACVVALATQKQDGRRDGGGNPPLGARVGNALISYCRYLAKLCWPKDLASSIRFPGIGRGSRCGWRARLLAGVSVLLILQRRRYPFFLMGWLWYLGTLVPVIGLVQVGEQAMADRYLYIPSLGVLIIVIWGLCELTRRWRYQWMLLSVSGSAALLLCLPLTRRQLAYWRGNETLFRHATEAIENNHLAHNNLGLLYLDEGQTDAAISQFQTALALKPNYPEAHNNLGVALDKQGRKDEAIRQFQEALRLNSDYIQARNRLGKGYPPARPNRRGHQGISGIPPAPTGGCRSS